LSRILYSFNRWQLPTYPFSKLLRNEPISL